MQRARPHLHLLSFTNFLVIVGWRRQPHVTEGQLSLWLPAVEETKHLSTYRQSQVNETLLAEALLSHVTLGL